jgi:hypothetical protein
MNDTIKSLMSEDIKLKDTTTVKEAESIRVIDALPRKVQTLDFINGGYCVAKCYGPDREAYAKMFVASPRLLMALKHAMMIIGQQDQAAPGMAAAMEMYLKAVEEAEGA